MGQGTHHGEDDRLELLLFELGGSQRFGINVLKVKEIIIAPALNQVPGSNPAVRGVTHLRQEPVTVVDLSQAIGRGALGGDAGDGAVIVTEFNRGMQGFLVRRVDRIVHCEWRKVLPPPVGTGLGCYITGVADVDGVLVQILDVEKVLGEVVEPAFADAAPMLEDAERAHLEGKRVLIVDDSVVARRQTANTLEPFGLECLTVRDGREALQTLLAKAQQGDLVDMVISDIEMPEMDGYSLTRAIRNEPALRHLYVLLHTSLNGAINAEKARNAGANDVLTKFVPEDLARAVVRGLEA